jgi:plastocyanin
VRPKRAAARLGACAALVAAGGCGSSASSHSTTAGPFSATGGSTAQGGLKVSTTPRYGSPPGSAPAQSGRVHVAYRNVTIRPDTLKVKVGSTVVWTNEDPLEHNVTSQSGPLRFASRNIREGQSFSVKMTRAGVIHYLCTIHPTTMNGTIDVVR